MNRCPSCNQKQMQLRNRLLNPKKVKCINCGKELVANRIVIGVLTFVCIFFGGMTGFYFKGRELGPLFYLALVILFALPFASVFSPWKLRSEEHS